MNLVIIAAVGKNNELGKDNELIWHLPSDLKFFREKTIGKNIVMGRKTFESLPKMLPNRRHIVITRGNIDNPEVEVYHSIDDFLKNYNFNEETYVIGGASIYSSLIDYADLMYLTEIDGVCPSADVYFPSFDHELWDSEVIGTNIDNGISYKHVLYRRR